MLKSTLASLADDFQILYPDLRGHGRSDRGSAESWNLRTWADDLRRLCDALGLRQPVVLGSSFGGDVALTYAALFPDHPGGVILANTTGGHQDQQRVIEAFGRLGGDEAAAVVRRIYAEPTDEAGAEFNRVCYPLYSGTPGWVEESRQQLAGEHSDRRRLQRQHQRQHPWSTVRRHTPPKPREVPVSCPPSPPTSRPLPPAPVPAGPGR